ncbi:MAG: hypothetical protein EAX81_02680 [Candidatus Thorarchaeota archaeon]|nr:hypothetical protein [Candidatus Thorarchaeota archaeon]
MSVTIILRGSIAVHVKLSRYDVEIGDDTILREVLQTLVGKFTEIQHFWSTPDLIDRDTLVLLNETDIGLTGGLDSKVSQGDIIIILPLVHGG